MAVYKDPKPTKNGRAWYFKFSYKDAFGATKQYRSKRYLTKKEASDAERMFLVTSTDKVEDNNMTFKDLYDEFRMHNDEIMKDTTKYGYDNKEKFIECFFPVKVKDFNIMQFEQWKREINKLSISLRYKNDIYKFLKSILNFGVKWHNLNFQAVYNKMTKFQDPNERRKEMSYYTCLYTPLSFTPFICSSFSIQSAISSGIFLYSSGGHSFNFNSNNCSLICLNTAINVSTSNCLFWYKFNTSLFSFFW